jgi:hypothetical protein
MTLDAGECNGECTISSKYLVHSAVCAGNGGQPPGQTDWLRLAALPLLGRRAFIFFGIRGGFFGDFSFYGLFLMRFVTEYGREK